MIDLILVVGASGSGKTTICKLLEKLSGGTFKDLVSYTTRPMREGETDGLEHWFVDSCSCDDSEMMAYTQFGGYEYWTSYNQLENFNTYIYIIDEEGIRFFEQNLPDEWRNRIDVTKVKIVRDDCDVDNERIQRDTMRTPLPDEFYDFIVYNNKTILEAVEQFLDKLNRLENEKLQKQLNETGINCSVNDILSGLKRSVL